MAYRNFLLGPTSGLTPLFGLRREIDRLFDDAFVPGGGNGGTRAAFAPAVDLREDEHEFVVHVDLPGIRPEDVDVSVDNGLLTVRGERRHERKEGEEGRWHVVERSQGTFSRTFQLPSGIEEERISADFEHGVLTLRIPKPALPQPRKIQIGRGQAGATAGTVQEPTPRNDVP